MQTSFHTAEFDTLRMPQLAWQSSVVQRYNASGESLEALRIRTTPLDTTNPYVTAHASCANAFLATAMATDDRYSSIYSALAPSESITYTIVTPPTSSVHVPETETPLQAGSLSQQRFESNSEMLELNHLLASEEIHIAPPVTSLLAPAAALTQPSLAWDVAPLQPAAEQHQPSAAKYVSAHHSQIVLHAEVTEEVDSAVIRGDAPANTLVEFYVDDVLVGSEESDAAGFWQFIPPAALPPAEYHFSAVVRDEQGDICQKSEVSFTIKLPYQPIIVPIIDDIDGQIDNALIDLALESDPLPGEIDAADFEQHWADHGLTPDHSSTFVPEVTIRELSLDELSQYNHLWH